MNKNYVGLRWLLIKCMYLLNTILNYAFLFSFHNCNKYINYRSTIWFRELIMLFPLTTRSGPHLGQWRHAWNPFPEFGQFHRRTRLRPSCGLEGARAETTRGKPEGDYFFSCLHFLNSCCVLETLISLNATGTSASRKTSSWSFDLFYQPLKF